MRCTFFRIFSVFIIVASAFAAAPTAPCAVSFNGYELITHHLNPHDVHDVPSLMLILAGVLPRGFTLHRLFDGEAAHELPDIVAAAVTVTVPSSTSGTEDFIAVGQLRSSEVWKAAQHDMAGVFHHLAGSVEKTRINALTANGRPLSVYISMPGYAISPYKTGTVRLLF